MATAADTTSATVHEKDPGTIRRQPSLQLSPKLAYGLLGLLLVYAIVRSAVASAAKPFWFDELLTLTVSSQATLRGIWRTLWLPLDGQPPFFYVIEKFAMGLTQNQEIAMRLPSILALPCTLTCVFVYVKKRGSEIVSLVCVGVVLMTGVFQYYALEARPYSMVVACIAFALLCYQRVSSPLWTVLFGASLALAESFHYMAVLAMVPFGLAEAVALWKTRRFRWGVWVALIIGTLPLIVFWKLISITAQFYGPHLWSQFQFSFLPWAYGDLFQTDRQFGAGIAAMALTGSLGAALWHRSENNAEEASRIAEGMLLFGFVALPFVAYVVTTVMHSGLTPRYVLCTVLGVALTFGYLLSRASTATVALFAVFVFSSVGVHELHFWKGLRHDLDAVKTDGGSVRKFIAGAGHPELPVVVPNGLKLVWLTHYAFPSSAQRFDYLVQDSLPQGWPDSIDKGMQLLQAYLPIRVSKFSAFTTTNKKFLIYREEPDQQGFWVLQQLSRDGWELQTIALDQNRRLYLVSSAERPPPQTAAGK